MEVAPVLNLESLFHATQGSSRTDVLANVQMVAPMATRCTGAIYEQQFLTDAAVDLSRPMISILGGIVEFDNGQLTSRMPANEIDLSLGPTAILRCSFPMGGHILFLQENAPLPCYDFASPSPDHSAPSISSWGHVDESVHQDTDDIGLTKVTLGGWGRSGAPNDEDRWLKPRGPLSLTRFVHTQMLTQGLRTQGRALLCFCPH